MAFILVPAPKYQAGDNVSYTLRFDGTKIIYFGTVDNRRWDESTGWEYDLTITHIIRDGITKIYCDYECISQRDISLNIDTGNDTRNDTGIDTETMVLA